MSISPQCHLIAVVGGKGGVGKSVFAANFAAALMLELRTQVLLIDADARSCGDQNVIMGLRPQKTLAEIANFTGLRVETVIRTFAKMKSTNKIEIINHKIYF